MVDCRTDTENAMSLPKHGIPLYIHASEHGNGHKARCGAVADIWPGKEIWRLPRDDDALGVVLVDCIHKQDADILLSRNEIIGQAQETGHLVVEINDYGISSPADVVIHYSYPENRVIGKRRIALQGPDYFPMSSRFDRVTDGQGNSVVLVPGSGGMWGAIEENLWATGVTPHVLRGLELEVYADKLGMADIVISAASVSAWEAVVLGKLVFIIQTADNQKSSYDTLIKLGVAIPYSDGHFIDHIKDMSLRKEMRKQCKKIVDGKGAGRIVEMVRGLYEDKGRMKVDFVP